MLFRSVDGGHGGQDDVLVIQSGRKQERSVLAPDARQVLRWVSARKKSFHGHQAAEATAAVATTRVAEILEQFTDAGLILRGGSCPRRGTPAASMPRERQGC